MRVETTAFKQGKTTAMLRKALDLARVGRAVYIVCIDMKHASALREQNPELDSLGVKFECADSLRNFEWETGRLKGAHPNCIVLVDHAAAEAKIAEVTAPYRKYLNGI